MKFYDVINKRSSIRDFDNEIIDRDTVKRIIDAAYKAPSNDHLKDYEFIVITDKTIASKVIDAIPKSFTDKEIDDFLTFAKDDIQRNAYKNAIPKQHRMLLDASILIIPLMKKKSDILHPDNLSSLNCFATIWCSIENMWLAATSEGYGCNLRIPMDGEENQARKILGFPENYLMPCFFAIGKPSKDAKKCKQIDYNLDELIHYNKF